MKSEYRYALDHYVEAHTTTPSPTLLWLERQTHLRTLAPQMLTGVVQGRLLSMLSRMMRPQRILEIGTYTGYGTICLAEGLAADGVIHTIDSNIELDYLSSEAFSRAGVEHQVIKHTGDALDIIPNLAETWDIIYLDGAKSEYIQYYQLVIDRLRPGGLLMADNVLWGEKVVRDASDTETQTLQKFNDMIQQDPRLENVLLPLRDGLMICMTRYPQVD